MVKKKKEESTESDKTTVDSDQTIPESSPSDLVPAEPKPAPAETKDEVEKPEKKAKKTKPSDDPFDAWMVQAKGRWPGSIETADNLPIDGTPTMSTGNFIIDRMTYRGLRRGRLYRFWGRPKSAKTGSALNCAEAFTNNHCATCFSHRLQCKCNSKEFRYAKVLYVDVEGRISDNRPWIEAHGIHPSRIAMVSPKGGEQVVDMADAALRSESGIGLVIIDSLAQMSSLSEVNKAAEKGMTIGRNALLINSALRKWVCSIVSKDIAAPNKPTIIMINQIRNKTDSMGSPDVQPGGLGQEFASACDVKFTKRQRHYLVPNDKGGFEDKVVKYGDTGFAPDEDDTADFIEIEAKVTESGICPPGRFGTFNYWLRAGHGRRIGDVDNAVWVWEYAKKYELMKKLDKGGYRVDGIDEAGHKVESIEGRTQKEVEAQFMASPELQEVVWSRLIEILNKK